MNKYVFFDVGANNGNVSVSFAEQNPNALVFAFEPNPILIPIIKERTVNLSNFLVFDVAVSDFNGTAKFNIASPGYSYGCSSLLELSEKAYTHWNGRTDMFVTDTIDVNVIRLDSIVEKYELSTIDYLEIDTQGCDINVLRGLGKYLTIVKCGQIEAAAKNEILYKNQNSQEESIQFLEENGFKITRITSNDHPDDPNEVNIEFERK